MKKKPSLGGKRTNNNLEKMPRIVDTPKTVKGGMERMPRIVDGPAKPKVPVRGRKPGEPRYTIMPVTPGMGRRFTAEDIKRGANRGSGMGNRNRAMSPEAKARYDERMKKLKNMRKKGK